MDLALLSMEHAAKFWSLVDRQGYDDCWPWQGEIHPKTGYGDFRPLRNQHIGAHRVAFFLTFGILTPGKLVCHSCDNRLCCNPRHLFEGTHQDNTDDMHRKGRWRRPRKVIGEDQLHHKLTASAVLEIRQRTGTETNAATAARFGVSTGLINHVRTGRAWRHV